MDPDNFAWKLSCWRQDIGARLQRAVSRSPRLRLALLGALSLCGYLLLLSPLLILVGTVSVGLQLGNNIRGPLEWLIIEVCAALGLFGALACYQLGRMRPAETGGVPLMEQHAPALFSMLERRLTHFRMRRNLDVRLAGDAKLQVVALPRWVIPLRHSYTLSVGAPLLFFVSKAQFRLALAAAVAASTHSRCTLQGRIQQLVRDWPVIIETLQQHPCITTRLLLPSLRRVAMSCARLNKGIATTVLLDQTRWVLTNTDEETARDLLTSQVLAGSFLENHYWPMTLKAAEHCPEPVVRPFSHFSLLLKKSFTIEAARRWLLKAQTGADSLHSELPDLLAELRLDGLSTTIIPEHSAFDLIFIDGTILQTLDKYWQQDIAAEWAQRHDEYQREKARFEQLQNNAAKYGLRGNSAVNFIRLANRFLEPAEAVDVYRAMYRSNTDDPTVCFASGQALLEAGHSLEGCDAIQRASELDGKLENRAHALMSQYRQSGRARHTRKLELARIA